MLKEFGLKRASNQCIFRSHNSKFSWAKGRSPLVTPACSHITSGQGIAPSKMLLSSDLQAISYNFVVTFNKIQTKMGFK